MSLPTLSDVKPTWFIRDCRKHEMRSINFWFNFWLGVWLIVFVSWTNMTVRFQMVIYVYFTLLILLFVMKLKNNLIVKTEQLLKNITTKSLNACIYLTINIKTNIKIFIWKYIIFTIILVAVYYMAAAICTKCKWQ